MNEQEINIKRIEQDKIRKQIDNLVDQYAAIEFAPKKFSPEKTTIPPSGKMIGSEELKNMVSASLDGWLTTGRFNEEFEKRLAEFIGVKYAITVNSGSSANLVAFSALTSPKLGDRAIQKGDEVIGVAAGFPTTVNPIIQFGAIPVFVDVDPKTFCIDPSKIRAAITPKTKMIIFSSPCNPSGSVMSESELLAWKNVLIKYPNIFILSDEIYEKINYAGKHCSLASYPELEGRIAVINGMSKGYAMTGWRLGYLAGPKELVQACDKIQGLMTSGASSVSQMASVAALDGPQDEVEVMRTTFEKRRNIFHTALSLIPNLPCNRPDGAFYLFPDVSYYLGGKTPEGKTITTADELCLYLLDKGHVSAVSGEAFGHANCIRFSYAAAEEQLIEAAERIAIAFRNLTH